MGWCKTYERKHILKYAREKRRAKKRFAIKQAKEERRRVVKEMKEAMIVLVAVYIILVISWYIATGVIL